MEEREKLIEVIRLFRYHYRKLPLRHVHGLDKLPLFLYLYERWLIRTKRLHFDVDYLLTLSNDTGALVLEADIESEISEARKMMFHECRDGSSDLLDMREMSTLISIVDKYGMIDYDSLLQEMAKTRGNYLSPEMIHYVPLPFFISKDLMVEKIKE